MLKKIKVNDLKVGMYVVLPTSWFNHPFLKSSFVLKDEGDISKIIKAGIGEVNIDTAKGVPVTIVETLSHDAPTSFKAPETWEPEKLVPDELREAVRDTTLSADKKARVVYSSATTIMARLLDDPRAKNISAAKEGINHIVDIIISDDLTSHNLLQITSHDYYTYTHSVNVGLLSILLSKALFKGSDAHNMHELGAGFFLHDIGKVRVAPEILNKPGKLTEEEMMKMRAHPYQGYKILSETNQLTQECRYIVLQHHERADGTGYPKRLKADDIHLYGRIGCIADVYDALTSKRSYKPSMSPYDALRLMKEQMIDHFHKELFDKFVLLFL
ncbi:MAG: HD-GYP domain-containing protein [Nitrospirae bacterium]|uniref:HD-GYP domain-containing protein n=1 Tax=Candidatus Magnetobacterium casense TaxID=1455061 RepID=UPI00058F9037|nr:HD-GYP domain-containing protein [Candidatus Magnetobacterium casensis]MBF0338270.1 HD-GYP domain-containing protein [Nitrospirota bacterium]